MHHLKLLFVLESCSCSVHIVWYEDMFVVVSRDSEKDQRVLGPDCTIVFRTVLQSQKNKWININVFWLNPSLFDRKKQQQSCSRFNSFPGCVILINDERSLFFHDWADLRKKKLYSYKRERRCEIESWFIWNYPIINWKIIDLCGRVSSFISNFQTYEND